MTYAAGNHPPSTPLRTTLASTLTAAGFVQVTANWAMQANWIVDVWKSPAASNSQGVDWHLLIADQIVGGTTRSGSISVCEGWDDATKTATRYIPAASTGVTPAADFSIGSVGIVPTNANIFWVNFASFTDSIGVPYKFTAVPDRAVVQTGVNAAVYTGLVDRLYSSAIDPVALVAVTLQATFSQSTVVGGSTREPAQTLAAQYNFRVQPANNPQLLNSVFCTTADPVTGKPLLSPMVLAMTRTYNSGASRRALMRDCRALYAAATAVSDTATEVQPDGSTRTLFCSTITSPAMFAGQL